MELAMGAMGPLFPKLLQLLEDKYVEQRGLKREVESLSREMRMVHAALLEVSAVAPERLSEPDKLWARQIRELSYDMEDAIDAFMVRVARREAAPADTNVFKKIARNVTSSVKKIQERHHISDKIKDIKDLSKELSELRARYTFNSDAPPVNTGGIDPRVINLYKNEGELVGIEEARDQLIRMLMHPPEDESLKIISIVGSGGLGKTTLAKVVHDQLKAQSFDCCAFVSVGRNPNITNTLREMLDRLCKTFSTDMTANWDAKRFCEALHEFLQDKRYNIVVDDVWEKKTWSAINYALPDSNRGSKVIVTTRNSEVSTEASDFYKLKPLSPDKSKELFYKRTSSRNGDNQLVDKIIDKCDGVPLAIIAIASLLADRPLEDWQMVYDSLICDREEDSTRTILLYSYYDLPSYLRPCLLYLSMYPEDESIGKHTLIWRWIAEGFVQLQKVGGRLFEIGERYFNELLNRSMIEPVENGRVGVIDGCRVHDIVLDLIRDLSTEENFVTVLAEKKFVSSEKDTSIKEEAGLHGLERKVRRLSIQWSKTKHVPQDTIGRPEVVRSLRTKDCLIDVPLLSSFQACRVLVAERSIIKDLKHLGKLLHLRYLELEIRHDRVSVEVELPKEIRNLKSLQTLIIGNSIKELPPAVCELTQLMCLYARVERADRIGNLVRLEELKLQLIGKVFDDFVIELGKLTRLRVLDVSFRFRALNNETLSTLMQSLNKLEEIRELKLTYAAGITRRRVAAWKSWKPPRQLWSLDTEGMGLSSRLMDPSRFRCLRYLCLPFVDVVEVNMGNLALLPELLQLTLRDSILLPSTSSNNQHQGFIVGADGFRNLRVCICTAVTKFTFLQGAMPRLESLRFQVSPESDLVMGLENLVSLKEVMVHIDCHGYFREDVEETEAVVRRAMEGHPNGPSFGIRRNRDTIPDEEIKPDKVVTDSINVRDCIRNRIWTRPCNELELRRYRWLEEITCDIDCEGSTLSEVEKIESIVRSRVAIARHPKGPNLVMKRINQDKMMVVDLEPGDDDYDAAHRVPQLP